MSGQEKIKYDDIIMEVRLIFYKRSAGKWCLQDGIKVFGEEFDFMFVILASYRNIADGKNV